MRWNLVAYYVIWIIVAKFANSQYLLGAYIFLGLYAIYHFKFLTKNKTEEFKFVFFATISGLLFDSFNNYLFAFAWKNNFITWLLPIWLMFAMTLNFSLALLFKNKIILTIFALVGGPWAYFAASKIMLFHYDLNPLKLFLHGALWVLFMFYIEWLRKKICIKN